MDEAHTMTPPLTWTTKPPTEPGWYWHKDTMNRDIVEVIQKRDKTFYVYCEEYGDWSVNDDAGTLKWAGPIPEPVEETL